ncbi:MAG: DEAD/DEAH box helicase [Holophagales bacterium]|nr:DEAD/DEAH box helicase [Holophagales bacterium]
MEQLSFLALSHDLRTRAARATLDQLGLAPGALRGHLRTILDRPAGHDGSFLADPVFEATFPWRTVEETMSDLAGELLEPALVRSMDAPPAEFRKEYRFPKTRCPYVHQVETWRTLLAPEPRSVVVTSGTGSGKTECFLVPILNDLAGSSRARPFDPGVRALFLYPLNALINSQRQRLVAWTAGLGGKARFCLYNGNTPEEAPSRKQAQAPQQVLSRKLLRESPPPILVTNASMLENMLVRSVDQPILQASQGKLRWVVLDEIHTYLGTQAAELALLLRRVLLAFGVDPGSVRFVATSATVGADDSDTSEALRDFFGDLTGGSAAQVRVIGGERAPAPLATAPNGLELDSLLDAVRAGEEISYDTLASVRELRSLRDSLASGGMALGDVRKHVGIAEALPAEELLGLLDAGARARRGEESFLPLRGHFLHRTQPGMWACANSRCKGRSGDLADETWPFGAVFLERRTHCKHCDSAVFEIASCRDCGVPALTCEESRSAEGVWTLRASRFDDDAADDDDELEALEGDDELVEAAQIGGEQAVYRRLIVGPVAEGTDIRDVGDPASPVQSAAVNLETGQLLEDGETSTIGLVQPDEKGRLRCPRCGAGPRAGRETFRPMRLGMPFYLNIAAPTLLDNTPGLEQGRSLPHRGRRLMTFSDSRQGTARFAVSAQLSAERNAVRSVLYHQLAAGRTSGEDRLSPEQREQLEALDAEARERRLPPPLEGLRRSLRERGSDVGPNTLGWEEARQRLASAKDMNPWMRDRWRDLMVSRASDADIAEFCLYREFLRRPRRANSLETLGLAALDYEKIERLGDRDRPAPWRARELPAADWRTFLAVALDHMVRANGAVGMPDGYWRWLGVPWRERYIQGPHADVSADRRVVRWPQIRKGPSRSRLVWLLATYLGLSQTTQADADTINDVLLAAWRQIRGLLVESELGLQLDLKRGAVLRDVREGWRCPVTRRVLPRALDGITPYLLGAEGGASSRCERVTMPRLPRGFWRDGDGREWSEAEIDAWLREDDLVREARRQGVWGDMNDRIARRAPYFVVVEHSAQLPSERLQQYEERFKEGNVNLLSSSTTMEMGVDVGGLTAVCMNNAPPSPSNFLQRAGRAGRRGEGAAASLTVCPATPHGEAVFRDPMWPFRASVAPPRVAMDSERIVARHVNSLLLGRYLVGHDAHRLTCGWFFEASSAEARSPAGLFATWLRRGAKEEVVGAVRSLVQRTALAGRPPRRLLDAAAVQIETIVERWTSELRALLEQQRENADPVHYDRSVVQKAIALQLERLRDEYLLAELIARRFLPAYGFPTGVVPFVNTTWRSLSASRSARPEGRFGASRGYPSRQLGIAVREYSPGAGIVLDGRIYESGGVTLNWHIPAGETDVRETQAFRRFWRCGRCGEVGAAGHPVDRCPSCGSENLGRWEFLEPAGFAVDLNYKPHNDLTKLPYVPVEGPLISAAGAEWVDLPAGLGRYRHSPEGRVFHRNRGRRQCGFAVCLRCGRAAEETSADARELPSELKAHRRLRGSSGGEPLCEGNDSDWAIKRRVWLGGEERTDVFELRLEEVETGLPINDEVEAYTIAVALRLALAESLGVDARELGCATQRVRSREGSTGRAIFLYDTASGGAGYTAAAARTIVDLLKEARRKLECPRRCDSACHGCLLSFDTQYRADLLDRHRAASVLSGSALRRLDLPDRMKRFGAGTRLETRGLRSAIGQELARPGTDRLRIHLGGRLEDWDVEDWRLAPDLVRWRADDVDVELLIPEEALEGLDLAVASSLASLAEVSGARLLVGRFEPPARGPAAEVGGARGSVRWAVIDEAGRAPGPDWGRGESSGVCVKVVSSRALPESGAAVEFRAADLRRTPEGTVEEVRIASELDGSAGGFGNRFWDLVKGKAPGLRRQIEAGGPVSEIRYADRYVRHPLTLRLFVEIAAALGPEGGRGTRLAVSSAGYDADHAWAHRINHAWPLASDRDGVGDALARLKGLEPSFQTVAPRYLPHAREFEIVWASGRSAVLRLDHGLGYWDASAAFEFAATPARQARTLNRIALEVKARHPAHPTIVYVTAVRGPG